MLTNSYALGLFFILLVAVLWAGASVLIQYIYQDLDFRSPFLLTYIANSLLVLYLPLWQLWVLFGIVPSNRCFPSRRSSSSSAVAYSCTFPDEDKSQHQQQQQQQQSVNEIAATADEIVIQRSDGGNRSSSSGSECLIEADFSLNKQLLIQNDATATEQLETEDVAGLIDTSIGINNSSSNKNNNDNRSNTSDNSDNIDSNSSSIAAYTHWDVLKMGVLVCPFWFLSNVLYNYSLYTTSVSSSTIISNLAASFTLFFSYCCGLEDATNSKILGIVICFLGAVCIALKDSQLISEDSSSGNSSGGDSSEVQHSFFGDVIALLSAMGYGMYTTLIRYLIPDDEGVSMQLLLGYIGLVNAVLLAPALLIVFFFQLENVSSLTGISFGFLTLNGLCNNVLSDYLWARSVVLTSPTVATIGLSITIPLAMISDFFLWNAVPTLISGFGAFLVIVGFVLVNISREYEEEILLWLRGGYQRLASRPCSDDLIP